MRDAAKIMQLAFANALTFAVFIPFPLRDTDGSSVSSVSRAEIARFRLQTPGDTDQTASPSVSLRGERRSCGAEGECRMFPVELTLAN